MHEIKNYVYSKGNAQKEAEIWEISVWRVRYDEFLVMAQERKHQLLLDWTTIHVGTENDAYMEMVKMINMSSQAAFPSKEVQEGLAFTQ